MMRCTTRDRRLSQLPGISKTLVGFFFAAGLGLGSTTAVASGVAGVDLVPAGRADLAWVDAGQLTGTLVSDTDGLLTGPLRAWAGWAGDRSAVLAGFSVARITTSTLVLSEDESAEPTRTDLVIGAVRPSLDYRRYFTDRVIRQARPYLGAGVYGVIPMVSYESTLWTTEEQASYDQTAGDDQARIGALGVRVGGGVEVSWESGLALGARYFVVAHRGREVSSETVRLSTLVVAEPALTLAFYFGS